MTPEEFESKLQLVKAHIGEYENFPIDGILFKDIFTALTNAQVVVALKDILFDYTKRTCQCADVIVGLDARGFLFGFMLAAELNIPFVPIRKKGKLPGPCLSYEYKLEYGSDIFEVQANAIKPEQQVIIVDDLLASGGTLEAACHLVEQTGGVVHKIIVIMEFLSLNGRSRINGKDVYSFIQYD